VLEREVSLERKKKSVEKENEGMFTVNSVLPPSSERGEGCNRNPVLSRKAGSSF